MTSLPIKLKLAPLLMNILNLVLKASRIPTSKHIDKPSVFTVKHQG